MEKKKLILGASRTQTICAWKLHTNKKRFKRAIFFMALQRTFSLMRFSVFFSKKYKRCLLLEAPTFRKKQMNKYSILEVSTWKFWLANSLSGIIFLWLIQFLFRNTEIEPAELDL
jgi:hypothetical protein